MGLRLKRYVMKSAMKKKPLKVKDKIPAARTILSNKRNVLGRKATISGIPTSRSTRSEHARLRHWEDAMRGQVDKKIIPGFSSCVIHKGEVVHVAEYGYADIEHKKPFTKSSICRVYCITKTVIAVGILILKERGQLKLSDPVYKYLPAFKKLRVVSHGNTVSDVPKDAPNVAKEFTILRLLTHTAGMGYGADFGDKTTGGMDRMLEPLHSAIDRHEMISLKDFCDGLARFPLRYEPAKGLNYGMGHDVLGRVIEVISGKTLDAFCEAEVFKPLGMCDTGYFVPREKASRLAGLYCNAARAGKMAKVEAYNYQTQPVPSGEALHRIDGGKPSESNWFEGRHCQVFSGNGILGHNMGGLVSTLSDQARFFTMILNGGVLGNRRILPTSTVEEFCFADLLPLPGATGKRRRTGQGWSGWSALGERGMKRINRDPAPKSDEYEEGEVAMGGTAQTTWSVNPVRDTVQLFFTQHLDSYLWQPDKEIEGAAPEVCPANFIAAARSIAPRDADAAATRRESLRARGI